MRPDLPVQVQVRYDEALAAGADIGLSIDLDPAAGWALASSLGGFRTVAADLASAVRAFRQALLIGFAGTNPHLDALPPAARQRLLGALEELELAAGGRRRRHRSMS